MPTDVAPTFFIGSIPIYGDLVLAPMDGFTDHPFRSIVKKFGVPLLYTEFINAIDVINELPYLQHRLFFDPAERPIGFQLFDDDPERLIKAALILMKYNPDFIDINMGCSEKSVSGRGAGAGLLREPSKVAYIFEKLSSVLSIPITGKIRLGWDQDTLNYLEIAHIIEENGGKLIAVHARTRKQYFDGKADWNAISEVKDRVSIPVIGNGDVRCIEDIHQMKQSTRCDAVMIGRAAIGNPWIFSGVSYEQVSDDQLKNTIHEHLDKMVSFYPPERGLVMFRKHLTRYISRFQISGEQRKALLTCKDVQFVHQMVDQWVFKTS